jgi:2,4-dichlorophenol 6-monooxygenase
MNQRYTSSAAITDGEPEPAFEKDKELHYAPTTWAGARLPHVWVFDKSGQQHSTLDITGKGRFTLLTGIGGEAWVKAAQTIATELKIELVPSVIGPRRDYEDHTGDWARAREIADGGCVIVRPDQHVAWRSKTGTGNETNDLRRILTAILAR